MPLPIAISVRVVTSTTVIAQIRLTELAAPVTMPSRNLAPRKSAGCDRGEQVPVGLAGVEQ